MKQLRALSFAILATSMVSAQAAVYLNRTDWNNAAMGLGAMSTETFDTAVGQLPVGDTLYNGLTVNVAGASNVNTSISGGALNAFLASNSATSVTITFAAPIRGFGFDITSPTTGDITVVSSVGVNTYNLGTELGTGIPGTRFFGVIEDVLFTQVRFTTANSTLFGEAFNVDNMSSVVPEPGTMAALALGAAAVASRRRRK